MVRDMSQFDTRSVRPRSSIEDSILVVSRQLIAVRSSSLSTVSAPSFHRNPNKLSVVILFSFIFYIIVYFVVATMYHGE